MYALSKHCTPAVLTRPLDLHNSWRLAKELCHCKSNSRQEGRGRSGTGFRSLPCSGPPAEAPQLLPPVFQLLH